MFGVEAQGNWADFHGRNVIPLSVPSVTDDTRVNAFGLFTGQVGYAANNVLFYLKGGAAVTSDRYRMLLTSTGASVANNVDDTRWGGVVGVGLEYGFAPNWSAGIEYNHMFMQDKTYRFREQRRHRPGWHSDSPEPHPSGRRYRHRSHQLQVQRVLISASPESRD